MVGLIDRVRPHEGQEAPNPVSPRQAMCLRFFFEPAVTDRFIRMTKKDVNLLFDAFYQENPGARRAWDSWKKANGIPEHTYLVDPCRVEQNAYATLGEPPLSLSCLQTFKTQKQFVRGPLRSLIVRQWTSHQTGELLYRAINSATRATPWMAERQPLRPWSRQIRLSPPLLLGSATLRSAQKPRSHPS
jgi:hypothetical protein